VRLNPKTFAYKTTRSVVNWMFGKKDKATCCVNKIAAQAATSVTSFIFFD
jgi:hypothetical protein